MNKEQIKEHINNLEREKEELSRRIYKGETMINDLERERLKIIEERIMFDGCNRDHLKLLKEMNFQGMWHGDLVSIGVCGKRPFGNSSYYHDIAEILGWELPNDDLSDKQQKEAENLLEELPFALNYIIRSSSDEFINKIKG